MPEMKELERKSRAVAAEAEDAQTDITGTVARVFLRLAAARLRRGSQHPDALVEQEEAGAAPRPPSACPGLDKPLPVTWTDVAELDLTLGGHAVPWGARGPARGRGQSCSRRGRRAGASPQL